MGAQDNKGIIPRLCDSLFDLIAKRQSVELSYKVEVSYMEIYNEKVCFPCFAEKSQFPILKSELSGT